MNLYVIILISFAEGISLTSSVISCVKNSDCSRSKTCINGFCISPCMEFCGPEALCAVMNHKAYCFCRDESEDCISRKVRRKCLPECEKHSVCNTDIGYCECEEGYHGNPYRSCLKKCTSYTDCPLNEICSDGSCINPCEEDCGVNASCAVVNQTSICDCPTGYTGNSFEICRPKAESLFLSKKEICAQCKDNAKCITVNATRCICPRGYVGNPYKSCKKMCLTNSDCPVDKTCSRHLCTDPCEKVCGVNSKCTVESRSRKPKCTCEEGFSGDPSRICTPALSTRFADPEDELQCDPKCGTNASCNTKYGICTCTKGHIGNPYGHCRKKCSSDSDCPVTESCYDADCKDPCLHACGKNAICQVDKHKARCRCPYGFIGDAMKICKLQVVTTQPSIIEVDLCDSVTCGKNAICRPSGQDICECLPGYNGNPYKICFKTCRAAIDCSDEESCKNGTCQNACIESCGLNSICKAKGHVPSCRCPDNYKGDPARICFPNAKGVLTNPSRVPCLKCICRAITGNNDIFACAEKSINFAYWAYAGEVLAGGEDFRTRNSTIDFITCMNDKICVFNTMNDYISRAMHRLNDIDCDGEITCADYFAVHRFGLTAKFNDSIFTTSEARSFDQCDDHGEKDVTDNWTPKKCIGPSYVEILS